MIAQEPRVLCSITWYSTLGELVSMYAQAVPTLLDLSAAALVQPYVNG